jgi:SRSO17 transposase
LDSKSEKDWKTVTLRKASRGVLRVRNCRFGVYGWDGEPERVKRWTVMASKFFGENQEIKMSLTNAREQSTLKRLAWMQRERYLVGRTFEDGESECAMADYQVRKWSACHHHMALMMMTMLFMLWEGIKYKNTYPVLSCADIEEFLSHFLPRRHLTEEVISELEQRHLQRQKSIYSHARCEEKME